MTEPRDLQEIVSRELRDAGVQWSMGTFGAIAEFAREPDEPARLACGEASSEAVTDKGGVRLACPPKARAFAYETISKTPDHWSQTVSLCLPRAESAMSGRTILTELGPDTAALRAEDREAVLFDLGLGTLQVDVAIRTADPDLLRALRANIGRNVFEPGNPAMGAIVGAGPHRVFLTAFGRAEVYQPIPAPDGKSPEGPHTHLLPKLLRSGRTHAATAPIPDGWVPCANLHPEHPARDSLGRVRPFDRAQHEKLQAWLDLCGDPALTETKRRVIRLVQDGRGPETFDAPGDRFGRAAVRAALRQAKALGYESPALARWRQVFDAPGETDEGEERGIAGAH